MSEEKKTRKRRTFKQRMVDALEAAMPHAEFLRGHWKNGDLANPHLAMEMIVNCARALPGDIGQKKKATAFAVGQPVRLRDKYVTKYPEISEVERHSMTVRPPGSVYSARFVDVKCDGGAEYAINSRHLEPRE